MAATAPGAPEGGGDGPGGRAPAAEPVLGPLAVDLDEGGVLLRVVLADRLDRAAVALGAGVGDDDPVVRGAHLAQAHELDLGGHGGWCTPRTLASVARRSDVWGYAGAEPGTRPETVRGPPPPCSTDHCARRREGTVDQRRTGAPHRTVGARPGTCGAFLGLAAHRPRRRTLPGMARRPLLAQGLRLRRRRAVTRPDRRPPRPPGTRPQPPRAERRNR